jgi:hypothetical protein
MPVIGPSDSIQVIAINAAEDSSFSDTVHLKVATDRFVTSTKNEISEIKPVEIAKTPNAWLLGIMIACLFALALIRFSSKNALQKLFQAVQSLKPVAQNLKYSDGTSAAITIPLFLFTVMVFASFVIILIQKFNILPGGYENYSIRQFVVISFIIAALLIAQLLFAIMSGFIFDAGKISRKYAAASFAFNVVTAIFILPLLMVSLYDRSLTTIYFAVSVFALLFILRTIKGSFIAMEERKYLLYHFFVYFCTLEILPILIIIKAIQIANSL